MVHEFHFMLDRSTKEQLFSSAAIRGKKISLSNLIKQIISMLHFSIRNEHKFGNQRLSKYENVAKKKDEPVEHVHVYFFEPVYRQLKCLHHDLNFYSIAQLLRFIIRRFIDLSNEHGKRLWIVLRNGDKEWRQSITANEMSGIGKVRHLLRILRHKISIEKWIGVIVTVYNPTFEPFWVFRL
jgi:hypothetical protein